MNPVGEVNLVELLAALFAGYVLGSVPTGYLLARYIRGVDIRTRGSGNIGATNVWRSLGPGWGIVSLVGDVAKGVLAVLLGRLVGVPGAELLTAAAALTGHGWSVFLRFQGGKIIATSLGVLFMLPPVGLAVATVVWLGTFGATRYVSLASILGAASVPLAFLVTGLDWRYVTFGLFMAVVALYKHRANIQRLIRGEESRFGARR
ncbi:MAG: glycerol-3-phosphate 1-O-acyltransferase PlsY [Candidatus Desulforudis sp.]|nr:glycerol-3-phosphate 1-O-acyltransferase PlsY [Desulforudis sp.]